MTHAVTIDILTLLGAAGVAAALIVLLRPLLQRYALARPNARSSHRVPTPQGGGIAVMAAATIAVAAAGLLAPHAFAEPWRLAAVFIAASALALVGATDDIRPLEAWPRLLLQGVERRLIVSGCRIGGSSFGCIARLPSQRCRCLHGSWFAAARVRLLCR